jgi:hypothetical protein
LNLRLFEHRCSAFVRREELSLVESTRARLSCRSWALLYASCSLSIICYTHFANCV